MHRLLIQVFALSTGLAFLSTFVQAYLSYHRELMAIEARMDQIQRSFVDILETSLWKYDVDQLEAQLNGILKLPDIASLVLISDTGKVYRAGSDEGVRRFLTYEFPLVYGSHRVGGLTVKASLDGVMRRLRSEATVILFNQLCLIFSVALILFLLFSRQVTRHLGRMADYALGVDAEGESGDLELEGAASRPRPGNELDQLVDAINGMRRSLLAGLEARGRAEEEVRLLNVDLERRVEERTAALSEAITQLQVANRAAEAASRAKSAFLASMSHELRTPLNAILGYAQLLRRTVENPESRDNLQRIHLAGEHLLGLINHVLSLSKIEAGKIALEQQDFATKPFFRGIEEITQVRAQAKGLVFALEIEEPFPASLVGDALKLRQVLVNLLGNAVKFTARGGVSLRVRREGERVRFEVQDSGPGMSEEEVASLFQLFHQARAGQQSAEGSGLGLYISQSFVHLMGGEITVRSEPGHGSEFHFEVPLAEGAPIPEEVLETLYRVAPNQSLKMLVVDDVEDNRVLLERFFASLGLEARSVGDGAAALAEWEDWRPDAIWMDLRMPVMDGYEATRRIREREKELEWPRTTVVALTASILNLDPAWVRAQGFDELMSKPFAEQEILRTLREHCGLEVQELQAEPTVLPLPDLGARILELPAEWVTVFERALVLGDREEAQDLLKALEDQAVSKSLAALLKDFRFEELRALVVRGGQRS